MQSRKPALKVGDLVQRRLVRDQPYRIGVLIRPEPHPSPEIEFLDGWWWIYWFDSPNLLNAWHEFGFELLTVE
jgi:hypothetical protein